MSKERARKPCRHSWDARSFVCKHCGSTFTKVFVERAPTVTAGPAPHMSLDEKEHLAKVASKLLGKRMPGKA